MASFADMKVSELENESNFTTRIKDIRVGDAMGYVEKNGKWYESYTDEDTNVPLSNKLLASVIGNTVAEMDGVLNDLTLAQAMGYTYVEKLVEDENGEEKLVGEWYVTYSDDNDDTNDVPITGFMKLVGPGTKINEIDQKINDIKESATIKDYMDAGILNLSASEGALDLYFASLHMQNPEVSADWKGYALDAFINAIISGVSGGF